MSAVDPRDLRTAFGSFMTGVTVVTARRADGTPVGFTANSFSSVSLSPPLLLVCPGAYLSSYDVFSTCTHFAISVLSEGQEDISNLFAGYKGDRFARVPHQMDLHDVPLISGATAHFSCTTHQIIPAGDHCVLMGRVDGFASTGAPGLGYASGQYFSRGLERAAFDGATGTTISGAIIEQHDSVLLERTASGWRAPHTIHKDRARPLQNLRDALAARGINAALGQAYSVFEDTKTRTHHTYFLATGQIAHPDPDVVAVPISELADLTYATPAMAKMMARFALERQTRSFGFYLGDMEQGDVHDPSERM